MNNIKKGMLHANTVEEIEKNEQTTGDDFVNVLIADKTGYAWSAQGTAGLVVITTKVHTEVDAIGELPDMIKLLATALIKVRQLTKSPEVVEQAIAQYHNSL